MSSNAREKTARAKFRIVAGGLTTLEVRGKKLGVDEEFEIEAGDDLDITSDSATGCFITCVEGEASLLATFSPPSVKAKNVEEISLKSGTPPTPLLAGWTYVLNVPAPKLSISEFVGDEDFADMGPGFFIGGGNCGGPDVMD